MAVNYGTAWLWILCVSILPFQVMAQSPDEEAMQGHMDAAFSWGKPMDVIISSGEVLGEEYLFDAMDSPIPARQDLPVHLIAPTSEVDSTLLANTFWPSVCTIPSQTFSYICPWLGIQSP